MTTETIRARVAFLPAFGEVLTEFRRTLAAIAAGQRAARDYEHLSSRSDSALAREGLRREDIIREIRRRHFA